MTKIEIIKEEKTKLYEIYKIKTIDSLIEKTKQNKTKQQFQLKVEFSLSTFFWYIYNDSFHYLSSKSQHL